MTSVLPSSALWALSVYAALPLISVGTVEAKDVGVTLASPQHFKGNFLHSNPTEKSIRADGGNVLKWRWKLYSKSDGGGLGLEEDFEPDKDGDGNRPFGNFEERKFDIDPRTLAISTRKYTGIDKLAKTRWSTITATGTGQSFIIGDDNKKTYAIAASISLRGNLNPPKKPPVPLNAEYDGFAGVSDPFFIFSEDIIDAGIDPFDYGFFVPFEISSFASSDISNALFNLYFETSDGRISLFDLEASPFAQSSATYLPGVSFYALSDIGSEPDFSADAPLDIDALLASVMADLDDDGALSMPLTLGALVTGISLPTDVLSNGAKLAVGYKGETGALTSENGFAPIPLPATGLLMVSGLFALVLRRQRPLAC